MEICNILCIIIEEFELFDFFNFMCIISISTAITELNFIQIIFYF